MCDILTRILVAVVGIPLLLLLVFLAPLWAFSIFVGIVSAGAAFEFLRCVEPKMPLRFKIYAGIIGFLTPVIGSFEASIPIFVLTITMFVELMLSFRKAEQVKLKTVLQVVFAGAIMPILLGSIVRIGLRTEMSVYLLLPFVAAFSSDSGGYFAGKFLGKHKAFPHLSPNKTVEGCIGGLVSAIGIMLLYGLVMSNLGYTVNYIFLGIYGLFGSVACQIGDLAFSAIKREYGIKDYGNLIPGHGGMLDRFDSVHFTAPMIEILVIFLPAIV